MLRGLEGLLTEGVSEAGLDHVRVLYNFEWTCIVRTLKGHAHVVICEKASGGKGGGHAKIHEDGVLELLGTSPSRLTGDTTLSLVS